ncbi:MAG: hypothetical protein KDA31_01900 [Phycisphaerales bacterium]|nr:hypothetical protein [Phycisphaerales bacterium]MCB9835130.1 hypothetical protein [Phycisphaera sp.]
MFSEPLTNEELVKLALNLDEQQPNSVRLRRKHPRLSGSGISMLAQITSLAGSHDERTALLVDVSAGGLQFIWPGFIHTDTVFHVKLQRVGGEVIETEIRSIWCRHLKKRFHTVGAMSKNPIPVRELVSPQTWLQACANNPELQYPVTGKLGIFSRNELTAGSAMFQVRDSDIQASVIESRGALIDLLERGQLDMVVLDADPEEIDITELLHTARGHSYVGPIVLLSMDKEAEYLAKLDPLNRCRFVELPMSPNAIIAAIRDIIRDHPDCVADNAEIYSQSPYTLHRDEALKRFISLAKSMCVEANHAMEMGRQDAVIKIAQSFAASGGSHGYPDLSIAALRYLAAAADTKQQKKLPALLHSIESIVNRLRPGNASRNAG